MLTEAVSVEGAVPLVGLRLSHEALSEAVQFNVPPPVLEMETFCVAGFGTALHGSEAQRCRAEADGRGRSDGQGHR